MIKTNFHTHTLFCDGKDTPEELVITAIEKEFDTLGFSGHSYFEPEKEINMSIEKQAKYIEEITELKEKYRGKINILCGIEQDYFSDESPFKYDYKIGSVHNICKNGVYLDVDCSAESSKHNVDTVYSGDFDAFAEDYFSLVSDVLEKTNADIIGHIDLISKFSEANGWVQSDRFLLSAEKAIKKLIPYNKPFEINTGAMSRGARTVPYPSKEILKIIKAYGGKIIFSSDCHDRNYLDYGFDIALELALNCGFIEQAIITEKGIEYIPIK